MPEEEEDQNEEMNGGLNVFLKARVLKQVTGFHKIVYGESTLLVNNLIESLINRGKEK